MKFKINEESNQHKKFKKWKRLQDYGNTFTVTE